MKRLGNVIGQATELGITMGVMAAGLVVLGLWAGRWLDSRLGTNPFATLLLIVSGAIAGQISVYRLATRSAKRLSENARHSLHAQDAVAALGTALKVLALIGLPGVVGIVLGLWIDRLLGTSILFTLVLVLGGSVLGIMGSLRLVYATHPRNDER